MKNFGLEQVLHLCNNIPPHYKCFKYQHYIYIKEKKSQYISQYGEVAICKWRLDL